MKHHLLLIIFLTTCIGFSQSTRAIIKDFDGDKKMDTVSIDSDARKLICALSSNNYKPISSLEIKSLNFGNTLVETKNGFEFWNDYGRSGWINEFEYNTEEKKMQLITMRRTDYDRDRHKFGPEVKHGSGKSSVNLLTNTYIGNFYDVSKNKLRKLPTITKPMVFTKTFLYCFSDAINFEFEKRCLELYEQAKKETP
ncbi:hypothetical protein [Lacinutrix chionoecetis]